MSLTHLLFCDDTHWLRPTQHKSTASALQRFSVSATMAPPLPEVRQFPPFNFTIELLISQSRQCIWYLPDKGRHCYVPIELTQKQQALEVLGRVSGSGFPATSSIEELASIAENCCCAHYHYNKIYGSGLALKLAHLWHDEIQRALGRTLRSRTPNLNVENTPAGPVPVSFARHPTLAGETLLSKLVSSIDTGASKVGSLYLYTHEATPFSGMVKIGYTSRNVQSRLDDWAECGHGRPRLLSAFNGLRHPERVELLVHFELAKHWYAQRWCAVHAKAHIEWFKVDVERAKAVARLWCRWMQDASPYDRRGHLKPIWKTHIDFLVEHQNPITAEAMLQIHGIETGSERIQEFINDEKLREGRRVSVKKEDDYESLVRVVGDLEISSKAQS